MKKIIFICIFMFAIKAFAKESNYKINDQEVDQLFAKAQDVSLQVEHLQTLIPSASDAAKNKIAAGLMGILCGEFGIHRFYLGHTKAGLIYLGWTLCSGGLIIGLSAVTFGVGAILFPLVYASGVVGIVDGIFYLISEDAEFESKYVKNEKLIQWIN